MNGTQEYEDVEVMPPEMSGATNAIPTVPRLDVANARRMVNYLTKNPQWLADPDVGANVNRIFQQASSVIAINSRLEAVAAQVKARQTQNFFNTDAQKKIAEIAAVNPDSVSDYMLPDADGNSPTITAAAYREISRLYKQHVLPAKAKDIKPKGIEILMPDGRKIPATYNPQTGSYNEVKDTEAIATENAKKSEIKRLKAKIDRLDLAKASNPYPSNQKNIQSQIDAAKSELKALESPVAASPPAETSPKKINSQEEYDALPVGSSYIDSEGKQAIKRK